VAPPSRHASGGTYEWQEFLTPADTDPAPLTEDILELLQAGKNPVIDAEIVTTGDPKKDAPADLVERAKAYVDKMPAAVAGDGGHDQTFVVALKLIHGFQLSDKQAMVIFRGYGARCKPPWTEKELLHKLQSARRDANDPAAIARQINPTPGKAPWLSTVQMTQTKNGFIPILIVDNVVTYLTHDQNPVGTPLKDAFTGKYMLRTGDSLRTYTNQDLNEINCWLQKEDRKMYAGKEMTQQAVETVAGRNAYHPVRDWLASLKWDGVERAETWLIRLAGVKDDAYVRAVSKKWPISAVARVMRPGCRADCMLVLEGRQGSRKSTAVDVLGRPWAVGLANQALHSEAAVEQLAGKWIVELAEMDGLRRSEVTSVKDFLSRTNDAYRQKYARVSEDHLRQCVFMGTCNNTQYLIDETGNRRFWPVAVTRTIDTDALAAERDQLFAESLAAFYSGTPWHLTEGEEALARDEQAQRVPDDAWEGTILPWVLAKVEEAGLLRSDLTINTAELMEGALEIEPAHQDKSGQMRVATIMKKFGWENKRVTFGKLQQKRWHPPVEEAKENS
jgi:predicted P-loop ATPase